MPWTTRNVADGTRSGKRESTNASSPSASADTIPPQVGSVRIVLGPQRDDTYAAGNRIYVQVWFNEEVMLLWPGGGPPPLTLALQIGTDTRHMSVNGCLTRPGYPRCGGPVKGIDFHYDVQESDRDPDGMSTATPALRLNGMRIQDLAGNDADLRLGRHAITNDPDHKVNGALDYPPMFDDMYIYSEPNQGDTYGRGEAIILVIQFDEAVIVTGRPTLLLTIGARTREAPFSGGALYSKNTVFFRYRVEATDRDVDGISVEGEALRLEDGTIRDVSGNEVPTNLEAGRITNHPDHKVDGRAENLPAINKVVVFSNPQYGDTYGLGETIEVRIGFSGNYYNVVLTSERGSPPLELTLHIGAEERQVRGFFSFFYEVQSTDYDPDGISIPENALRQVAGTVTDGLGRDITDLSLGDHAIANDPLHKVNGRLMAVGPLSPLGLTAGGQAATVDLSPAFQGLVTSYDAVSTNPEIATVAVAGAMLTVSPVEVGEATVKVTARNATETATQSFPVTVFPSLEAVGTLPPLELTAGGQAATVDLSLAFQGLVTSHVAMSTNPEVATVAVAGAALTVSPAEVGEATIEVTARNATETATQSFLVAVVVAAPAEMQALESTFAAFGRSLLASATVTIEERFNAAPGRTSVAVAGHQLPVGAPGAGQRAGLGTMEQLSPAGTSSLPDTARVQASTFRGGRVAGRVTGTDLLRASRFLLAFDGTQPSDAAPDMGARWTVWGGADLQTFRGEPATESGYDGATRTAHVGVDLGDERWLAGTVVSRTAGRADYYFGSATRGSGRLATTLTSVQPYLRWAPRGGTAVWAILGTGRGVVENVRRHVGRRREESNLSMWLGVVGGAKSWLRPGRSSSRCVLTSARSGSKPATTPERRRSTRWRRRCSGIGSGWKPRIRRGCGPVQR